MAHFRRKPLTQAVSLALAGTVASAIAGSPAAAQEAVLEEITVTAQKRTESLQDVPVSVQVLSSQQLHDLHLTGFADYIEFLPTVSVEFDRPGVAQVYMRGIASGGDGVHSGSMPSVGVYLDEQPITTISNFLDMHIYDVARIETLAGPQGTFFGASSQSGTIRIITNKPEIGEFSAAFDATVNSVAHGGIGHGLEGFVNLPVSDNSAIRLVAWHKYDAGYIDNVPGTIVMQGTPQFVIDNSAIVEEDFNDTTISGLRALLKIDLNDNWTATPGIVYQQMDSNGVYRHDPEDVGDLQIQHYFPEYYDDEWYQATLTLEGGIGNLDFVYAGAYLDRHVDSAYDYIGYAQYWQNRLVYQFDGYCYHHASTSYYYDYVCTDSSQWVSGDEDFTRQSHEVRLQSSQDGRFRWVAGLFYQRQRHYFDLRWNVPGMDPLGGGPFWPGVTVVPGELVVWQTNQDRIDRDWAFFGEVEVDLNDDWTVVGGYRRFDFENSLFGFNGWVGRCLDANGVPQYPCISGAPNVDDVSEGDGNSFKFSVNYHLGGDKLLYATYSEGFRAGGVNRASVAGVTEPKYSPDYVDNYEIGWKTTWMGGRMRFNGAAYYLEWDNFQFSFLDQDISPLTIIQNVGQASSRGTEFDLAFAASDALLLTLSASYNDAKLEEPFWTSGAAEEAGEPPDAPADTQMPLVPEWQATATGRYEVDFGPLPGYFQAAVTYTGDSWNLLQVADREKQPSYTILNLATGLRADVWSLDLFLDNVTDERAEVTRHSLGFAIDPFGALVHDTAITTNRPRTIGLRFGRDF